MFRVHALAAQLLFELANEGALVVDADAVQNLLVRQAAAIGLKAEGADAMSLVERATLDTELQHPDLFWIAEPAQAATTRLLYRETSIEDSETKEIVVLELMAFLSARKGSIPESQFMKCHRIMFGDEMRPREILSQLELLVAERSGRKETRMGELIDPVDVTIPIISGVLCVDAKKAVKAIKKLFRGDA